MGQLIYIEQKDKDEATRLLKGFTDTDRRKKAYINSLGAELIIKYLAQEGINVDNIFNMHNIFRIRDEFEIADIMLPNIHIDVRMIYDENLIFVPKTHSEYDLSPDIYVVLKTSEDGSYVDFIGFFEPKIIDTSKQNDEYYFVDKKQLISPDEFISYVRTFDGNTTQDIAETDDLYKNAISLADDDISVEDKKALINFLKKSVDFREEMIEFDNFEWLSYTLTHEDSVEKNFVKTVDEFDAFDEKDEFDDMSGEETPFTESDTIEEPLADLPESMAEISEEASSLENVLEPLENAELVDLVQELPELDISAEESSEEQSADSSSDLEELADIDLAEQSSEDTTDTETSDVETINEELTELPEQDNTDTVETETTDDIKTDENLVDMPDFEVADTNTDTDNTAENSEASDELVSLEELESVFGDESESNTETENNADQNVVELENISELDDLLSLSEPEQEMHDAPVEEVEPIVEEPVLQEPVEENSSSYENSTVITNEAPVAGEIPIDINMSNSEESIEVLYNDETKNIEEKTNTPEAGKKGILVVAAVATVLAVGGVTGYFALNNNKGKMAQNVPPMPEHVVPPDQITENPLPEDAIQPKQQKVSKEKADDLVNQAKAEHKTAIESPFIEVKKLGWAVPDYVSYNDSFRTYLQTVSKSLKLALSSDLLSATEYPYSNQINVDIELSKTGSLVSYRISKSSGSEQIDKIVLQTVKDTLVVVKVPTAVIVGDKIRMTLKIYL